MQSTSLKRVYSIAQDFLQVNPHSTHQSLHALTDTPPLNLTPPEAILAQYKDHNIPPHFLDCCLRRLTTTMDSIQAQYHQTCHRLAINTPDTESASFRGLIERLRLAFTHVYDQETVPQVINILLRAATRNQQSTHEANYQANKRRGKFSYHRTAILESYFEKNAYPPASDKAILAEKCMISHRQVDVWFQNRRNRRKKTGGQLPRIESSTPLEQLHHLTSRPCSPLSESSDVEDSGYGSLSDKESEASTNITLPPASPSQDVFSVPPPAHTFPTKYCRTRKLSDERVPFLAPAWMRKASQPGTTPCLGTDVNELVLAFSTRLHINGRGAGLSGRCRGYAAIGRINPWLSANTAIASSAPHPALIRCPISGCARQRNTTPFKRTSPYTILTAV
ncbi:hypothetical protein AX15_001548 [Amanita polypyramis BW_CC]|nr:hypothetical protein AX15_001548 [Amanita polypyramis BW_CC]